jgi:hypothetical protein
MARKRVLVLGAARYNLPLSMTRAAVALLDDSSAVPCVVDAAAGDGGVMVLFDVTLRRRRPTPRHSQVTKLRSVGLGTTASARRPANAAGRRGISASSK